MNTNNLISMSNSLKTIQMQNAFRQRLATGDMTTKRELSTLTPVETADADSSRLELIRTKLQYGAKLTDKEREYLKKKDPKAYADLVKEEEEQKSFERVLRTCRTREEAQHLKLGRITRSLNNIKTAEKSGELTKEEKLSVAARELRNINHAIKATDEYLRGAKLKTNSTRIDTGEDKLRELMREHLSEMINRASEHDTKRYDTFISSDSRTFEDIQNDAIEAIRNLYATEENE